MVKGYKYIPISPLNTLEMRINSYKLEQDLAYRDQIASQVPLVRIVQPKLDLTLACVHSEGVSGSMWLSAPD